MTHVGCVFFMGLAVSMTAIPSFAADRIGNCELTGTRGSIPIASPASMGELTVQVSLPAPLWWNGTKADTITDGMEYCMAAEIAWRAGYDKLKVVPVDSFTSDFSGATRLVG